MTTKHITLTNLSKLTGRHLVHLSRLVNAGTLPMGYVVGKTHYVPQEESLLVISKLIRRKRKQADIIDTIDDLLT